MRETAIPEVSFSRVLPSRNGAVAEGPTTHFYVMPVTGAGIVTTLVTALREAVVAARSVGAIGLEGGYIITGINWGGRKDLHQP